MNNHQLLVEGPRAIGPEAMEAIHDAHADALLRYCWFMLRSEDAAQIALRDSLIVAAAHLARLPDPAKLRPWLYAIARSECLRRRPSPASDPGAVARSGPARHGPDPTVMAWQAVMDISPLNREALELSTRHGLEPCAIALVLGIPERDVAGLLAAAREAMEQALAGEVLAHAVGNCRARAAILADWAATPTASLREKLVLHAARCEVCMPALPRNVSVAKVFGLLPVVKHSADMRARTLACLNDPALAGYRTFVVGRAVTFDNTGFPVAPATAGQAAAEVAATRSRPLARRFQRVHLWVGLAAAIGAVTLGAGFAVGRLGGFEPMIRGTSHRSAGSLTSAEPSAPVPGTGVGKGSSGRRGPRGSAGVGGRIGAGVGVGVGVGPGKMGAPAPPLGVLGTHGIVPGEPIGLPSPPGRQPLRGWQAPGGRLQLSSSSLDLGTASQGTIALSAVGGPVTWSASTSSPQLALGSYEGTLAAGAQVTVTVTVTSESAGPGRATLIIGPGNLNVVVTWSDSSRSPAPSPSPSQPGSPAPAPSGDSSATPAPSPSASATPSGSGSPASSDPAP